LKLYKKPQKPTVFLEFIVLQLESSSKSQKNMYSRVTTNTAGYEMLDSPLKLASEVFFDTPMVNISHC
jgi:hypothetical protein